MQEDWSFDKSSSADKILGLYFLLLTFLANSGSFFTCNMFIVWVPRREPQKIVRTKV